LVFDPAIVLLDEPLGALDRQLRETMQYELKRLHKQTGVTMVYVTHDQGEAMTLSDRVAVFRDGAQLQCAPPRELYDRPENAFVAEFVGENNRLAGVITAASEDSCEVRIPSGDSITVERPPDLGVGAAVLVYLRPERVMIGQAAESCGNNLLAKVVDVTFLGDHTRLQLEMPGNAQFIAKQNLFGRAALPRPGDQLRIGWTKEAPQILAAT
jgi:putative spermidine/putrescine transport system ATP-binding protein